MNTSKFLSLVKQNVIFWLFPIAIVFSKPVLSANLPIAQTPLAVSDSASPRVMLAMSRDHQLFIKAYTDYSDLNKDGILDTTYNDSIDYYGYFDSNKCYTNDGGSTDVFVPRWSVDNLTANSHEHHCSSNAGDWSGNFLNWAAMTRMDIIRKVLYGGYRYLDTAETVLERTLIPYDVHAFAKVFSTATTAQMQQYTPYEQTTITICNSTQVDQSSSILSKDISTITYPPLMRIARGSWPRWAASKNKQCQWSNNNNDNLLPGKNVNLVNNNHEDGLNVRVRVCVSGLEEANCKNYTASNSSRTITKKPTGLLQKYWDNSKPISFGLMTGSWGKNKSGGVLRANAPISAPNTQEVNPGDGKFRLSSPARGGIIATLNRLRISKYQFDRQDNENKYKDCDTGKLSFNNGECVDWGNPLSEIYLETLRYLAGKTSATSAFDTDDTDYAPNTVSNLLPPSYPLSQKTWVDPINPASWCARSSIVAISTGLNSFDTDQLDNDLDINVAGQTKAVGDFEGISGDYLIGSNGSVSNKQCTAKSLSNLSSAQGICPEMPSQEGGYHIAGLAYYARTHDMRPDQTYPGVQSIHTYSVALAESLPRFEIPIPSGSGAITILPACEANSTASATDSTSNWRPCSMSDLIVESLNYDDSGNLISGSFMVNWEDSTWGSNNDMDGIERLEFCVGSACGDSVLSGSIKITASVIQAESNAAMRFGYTITGSTDDGINLPVLRPGGSNFNYGDILPVAKIYNKGSPSAKLLENPLWYAAKYGGFETIDADENDNPVDQTRQSWDQDENGSPDAFFMATNPTLLESALDEILSNVASKAASSASVAANSTRLDTTKALYQAKFTPAKWTGQLLAFQINAANGSTAEIPSWDASVKLTDQITEGGYSERSIFSYNDLTQSGIDFNYANLSATQKNSIQSEAQLNYIKGDSTNEKPDGPLRTRIGPNRLMGDIVNSDPEFINSISQGYDSLPGNEGRDYLKFITSPAYRDKSPMLAVGANDGMLHVFNASVGIKDGEGKDTGGNEILAYVPSTILDKLLAITLPTYVAQGNHKYLVDGTPNTGDAYFDADANGTDEWRKVLIGTTGIGGKGIFALDMTLLNPENYKETEPFSASRVLWEINDKAAPQATDLADDLAASPKRYGFTNYLGLTMGQASIVRMANGQFAAVFGNGYNSGNGIDTGQTAVLYIVNIENGHLIRSITTGVGNALSESTSNGLATPLTVDANGDRIVDAIYAGDYLGNMWKFDVSDSNPNLWGVAFTSSGQPAPLFTAISTQITEPNPDDSNNPLVSVSAPQPITSKPEFSNHPKGGIMLYFGTGKYFLNSDQDVSVIESSGPVETFYGIWDECVKYAGGAGSCSNGPISGKSQLVEQSIDYEATKSDFKVRVTSKNGVDYLTKKGWYMELFRRGSGFFTAEKVISQPIINGRRIIFSTILPARGLCSFGGTSWLMLVDALTGKSLDVGAFDLTGDANFNPDDKVSINILGTATDSTVSGVQIDGGISKGVAVVDTDGNTIKLDSSTSSGKIDEHTISKLLGGRQSWLQIR